MNEHLQNAKGKAETVSSIPIRDFTKATRQMLLHWIFNWPMNQLKHLIKSRLCSIVDAASTTWAFSLSSSSFSQDPSTLWTSLLLPASLVILSSCSYVDLYLIIAVWLDHTSPSHYCPTACYIPLRSPENHIFLCIVLDLWISLYA